MQPKEYGNNAERNLGFSDNFSKRDSPLCDSLQELSDAIMDYDTTSKTLAMSIQAKTMRNIRTFLKRYSSRMHPHFKSALNIMLDQLEDLERGEQRLTYTKSTYALISSLNANADELNKALLKKSKPKTRRPARSIDDVLLYLEAIYRKNTSREDSSVAIQMNKLRDMVHEGAPKHLILDVAGNLMFELTLPKSDERKWVTDWLQRERAGLRSGSHHRSKKQQHPSAGRHHSRPRANKHHRKESSSSSLPLNKSSRGYKNKEDSDSDE